MAFTTLVALALAGAQTPLTFARDAKVTLENGAVLQVLAVSDDAAKISWGPDGKKLKEWVEPADWSRPAPGQEVFRTVVVRYVAKPATLPPSIQIRLSGVDYRVNHSYAHEVQGKKGTWHFGMAIAPLPPGTEASVDVYYATGPWNDVGSVTLSNGKHIGQARPSDFRPIVADQPSDPKEPRFAVSLVFPDKSGGTDYRVVATDSRGRELRWAGMRGPDAGKVEVWFVGHSSDVKRIELQGRPFKKVSFSGVNVSPK
jgi:hypothetical protein